MNMKKTTVLAILASTLFGAITPVVAESEEERNLQAIGPSLPTASFCSKAGTDCMLCMASACAMQGSSCVPTCNVNDLSCYSSQRFPGQSINQICSARGNLRGNGGNRQDSGGGGTVNVGNQGMTNTPPSTGGMTGGTTNTGGMTGGTTNTGGMTGGTTNTWVGNQDMTDIPPSTGSTRCAVGQLGVYDPINKVYQCIQNPCAAGEKYQWGGFRDQVWACVPYTPNGTPVGGSTNNNKDKNKNKNKNRNGSPGLFP